MKQKKSLGFYFDLKKTETKNSLNSDYHIPTLLEKQTDHAA